MEYSSLILLNCLQQLCNKSVKIGLDLIPLSAENDPNYFPLWIMFGL